MERSTNILAILGIVGGAMLIAGVFLNWIEFEFLAKYTGWEVFDKIKDTPGIKYTFLPLVDLICGILAMVLMIVPTFVNGEGYRKANNILGIMVTIMAVAVIAISILFLMQEVNILLKVPMTNIIAPGFWVSLIGAIIALIGGLMPLARNRIH